MKNTLSRLLLL